jgi:Xaa-Pro aminopeptidase
LLEAMRSTEPGVTEYQLDAAARYVFLVNDARLDGYSSITASGTENINNMHYFRNTSTLKSGDLVLMDYAPDYRYYVSDIGRIWPVNGKYNGGQRELLQFVLEFHKAVLSRIRPGVTASQIHEEAKRAMEPVFRVPEENLYLRYEDTVVVTETGVENFTDFLPMELDDIEKVALDKGVVQKVPPVPASTIAGPGGGLAGER